MELTTEQRTKLEPWLERVTSGGGLAMWVTIEIVLFQFLSLDLIAQLALLSVVGLATLSLWLLLRNLRLQSRLDKSQAALLEFYLPIGSPEPGLSDESKTILCMVFDKQPFATEPHEMTDKLRLNDDDLEDALEPLVKYDYLNFDVSGRVKPARSGRVKTSHFERSVYVGGEDRFRRGRNEPTQSEHPTVDYRPCRPWLVPAPHRAGAAA